MDTPKGTPKTHAPYSEDFKHAVCLAYETEHTSARALASRFGINKSRIAVWCAELGYSSRGQGRRWTPAQKLALIEGYFASNMTQAAYCAKNKFSPITLRRWLSQSRSELGLRGVA